MKAIECYQKVMNDAINDGIRTNEELDNSKYKEQFWTASYKLAKAIVYMNFSKTLLTKTLKAEDHEDDIMNLTILLVKRFGTQVRAILNPQIDEKGHVIVHNHNAYTSTIFTNMINDSLKKYKIDPDSDKKEYFTPVVLSTPVSKEADSITIGDIIESKKYVPENDSMEHISEAENNRLSMLCLKQLIKKAYIGQSYVYICDTLRENGVKNSLTYIPKLFDGIQSKPAKFQKYAYKHLVRSFNRDLAAFVDLVSEKGIDDEGLKFVKAHLSSNITDFGESFVASKSQIYRLRNRNKSDLRGTIEKNLKDRLNGELAC